MRRSSSIETLTSPSLLLHPVLQAALDNLDVQLEEELSRYRRRRRFEADQGGQNRQQLSTPKPLGRAAAARAATVQLPKTENTAVPDQLSSSQAVTSNRFTASFNIPNHSKHPEAAAPVQVAPNQLQKQAASAQLTIAPEPASAEPSASTASTALSAFEPDTAIQNATPELIPELAFQAEEKPFEEPEDYLESSEELLKSIAEENVELRAEQEPGSLLDTLLNPVGIGSMLLLLLSSATLGYIIMNPSSLSFFTAQSNSNSSLPLADKQPSIGKSDSALSGSTPLSPDLAADEFHDLNLNTLSTLPKDSIAGSPTTAPTANSAKTNSTDTAVKPGSASRSLNSQRQSKPQEQSVSTVPLNQPQLQSLPPLPETRTSLPSVAVRPAPPAPAPLPPAPQPISAPPPSPVVESTPSTPTTSAPPSAAPSPPAVTASNPSPRSYYYVVTDYSGDPSLQQARQAVPDAYVRNLPTAGAKVQLGAFSDEDRAQERIQELQQKGISAQVYQSPAN